MNDKEAYRDMIERCHLCGKETRPTDEDCARCYFPNAMEALQSRLERKKDCEECEYAIPIEITDGLYGFEYGDECYACKWCMDLEDRFTYRKVDEDRGQDY